MNVFFDSAALQGLEEICAEKSYSRIALLCDSNTHEHCLPDFLGNCPFLQMEKLEVLELEPGEETKSLEVLAQLWDAFGALNLDRKSLLINLGGGVITDIGGFAAATYMRGIDFVNFPTSLLAMVDASVGGKTGINFSGFKNRIGSFYDPLMVGIWPQFLETLSSQELHSGKAEMLKHGLIADYAHFQDLISDSTDFPSVELIQRSIEIKASIVTKDQKEGGLRKVLNFGHTIGHALESYFQEIEQSISHGEAVALGILVELDLSSQYSGLKGEEAETLIQQIRNLYPIPTASLDWDRLLEILAGDKKNEKGSLLFALLEAPGKAVFDIEVAKEHLVSSLKRQLL